MDLCCLFSFSFLAAGNSSSFMFCQNGEAFSLFFLLSFFFLSCGVLSQIQYFFFHVSFVLPQQNSSSETVDSLAKRRPNILAKLSIVTVVWRFCHGFLCEQFLMGTAGWRESRMCQKRVVVSWQSGAKVSKIN